tara:strand:- start:41531 stop:43039 length:1509 start_codon:yes stop_codon:yes gene_type:complete
MKVKNIKGDLVDRDECQKIKGEYYQRGDTKIKNSGECYLIDGKYHRFNNGLIEYDHEQNEYVLTNKIPLRRGIISFDELDKPVMGFFSANPINNVKVHVLNGSMKTAINSDILIGKYKEYYHNGEYYHKSAMTDKQFKSIKRPPVNKKDLQYDSRFASKRTEQIYAKYYEPSKENHMIDMLGNFLDTNGITFGVEFETSTGYIPGNLCYKHGLLALQDGSIGGLEYVTVPLSGKKGLYNLMDICEILKERTKYDFNCSMHVHIGGMKRKVENLTAVNNIACMIEDDVYKLQPFYKKSSKQYGKGKDYSAPLNKEYFKYFLNDKINPESKVSGIFEALFSYLSMGRTFGEYDNDLKNVNTHPSDPNNRSKWNIKPRYAWFNIIPVIFTNKQTVEFRQHNNTFDFFKLFHFILTSAIVVVAANKYSDKFNDTEFLKSFKNKKSPLSTLIEYVTSKDKSLIKDISDANLLYNKEREKVMKTMNAEDPKGESEHTYYESFTNNVNG